MAFIIGQTLSILQDASVLLTVGEYLECYGFTDKEIHLSLWRGRFTDG